MLEARAPQAKTNKESRGQNFYHVVNKPGMKKITLDTSILHLLRNILLHSGSQKELFKFMFL